MKHNLLKIANDLWFKDSDEDGPKTNSWSTEASQLQHMGIQATKCPGCNSGLPKFSPARDGEGEVTHSVGKCRACGANLTIWND